MRGYFMTCRPVRLSLKVVICFSIIYALLPLRFAVTYEYIPNNEIPHNLVASRKPDAGSCALLPKLSVHDIQLNSSFDYDMGMYAHNLRVEKGGSWKPDACEPVHDTAIVVPYRGRQEQLNAFLYYIHPFLQKQLISYRVFVVEQTFSKPFNRGLLLNVGFLEALKMHNFHCFIFHDVDLLPIVARNMYACTTKPRHLSAAINTWRYKLKYLTAFGGVVAILQKQFHEINGFSNKYFGWGGEDDDLYERFSPEISKYYMLLHKPEAKNSKRLEILKSAHERFDNDGLNSVDYSKLLLDEKSLYTHILVDVL